MMILNTDNIHSHSHSNDPWLSTYWMAFQTYKLLLKVCDGRVLFEPRVLCTIII